MGACRFQLASDLLPTTTHVSEHLFDAVLVDGLEALGADRELYPTVLRRHPKTLRLNIWIPPTTSLAHRVGDVITERWLASRHLTDLRHKTDKPIGANRCLKLGGANGLRSKKCHKNLSSNRIARRCRGVNVDQKESKAGAITEVTLGDDGGEFELEGAGDHLLPSRLDVDFQPIVSTATDRIVGVDVQPRATQLEDLDLQAWRLMLLSSLMTTVRWRQRSLSERALFLNITVGRRQLQDSELDRSVRSAIAASGADPARLVLCLSDDALLHADDNRLVSLIRLEEARIHLAITGPYATAHAARHYDVLRFEQLRVPMQNAAGDPNVHRIVARTHALGMAIVATGVTSERDLDDARRFGAVQSIGPLHSTTDLDSPAPSKTTPAT